MPATQLSGGSHSYGLTNRGSNHGQTKENYRPSLSLHREEASKLFACSGRKDLSCTNFENRYSLSARHGKFLAPLVEHSRKTPFPFVGNQLSSDFDVGTSEFDGGNEIVSTRDESP